NLPGGAHGSLVSNGFSLAGYSAGDQPTLYYDYLLQTDNGSGSAAAATMTDSARVFISADGGQTGTQLASNNPTLSTPATKSELPTFLSNSVTANPNASNQEVQQMYGTNNWRQAHVDLSPFAGKSNLQLRFDFSTSGTTVKESGSGLTTQGITG